MAGGNAEEHLQFGGQPPRAQQQPGEPLVAFDDDQVGRAGFAEQDERRGQPPVPEVLGDLPVDRSGWLVLPRAEPAGAVGGQPGPAGELGPVRVVDVLDRGQLGRGLPGAMPPDVGGIALGPAYAGRASAKAEPGANAGPAARQPPS